MCMFLIAPWKKVRQNFMGNEITMEGILIFHDSLIFNASRKNHGFFMGHQFSDTIKNPLTPTPWKYF